MANPNPQALRDAAATLRDQAKSAREVVTDTYRREGIQHGEVYDRTKVKLDTANAEVKSHEQVVASEKQQIADMAKKADELHQQALDVEKTGDGAKAAELRETEGYVRATADVAAANLEVAQKDLNDSRVTQAERQRDFDTANQAISQVNSQRSAAERQLDAMENRAALLDEAGLKLALAATIDNPVERADLELAAEKMVRDANGIRVDTAPIVKVTGQELQLPDTTALPAADPTASADATPTGDTGTTGDTGATGDGASGADAQAESSSGHLDDEFAALAAADGSSDAHAATGQSDATAPPDAGAVGAVAAGAASLDDPLGVGSGASADTLGVDASPLADAAPTLDAPGPAAEPATSGAFDPATDETFAAAPAPDPAPDVGVATDSFSDFSADPSADATSVTSTDDVDA